MPEESKDTQEQFEFLNSVPLDDSSSEQEKIDAIWRQLTVFKNFGDSGLSDARARRAQAEAAREQAQMEAVRTTQLLCARMRTEAELELQEAKKAKSQAQNLKEEAQEELTQAKSQKEEAEKDRQRIVAEAQKKAQAIIEGANDIAKRETTELRRQALKEVKSIMSRVESLRATADEELETQRIMTNISKIKATSRWMMESPTEQVADYVGSSFGAEYAGTSQNGEAASKRPAASRRSSRQNQKK